MKLFAFLAICMFAVTQGQLTLGGGPIGAGMGFGFPSSQFFQDIVLQSEAQKLLTQPGFPVDLQERVTETLTNAEIGFSNCNTIATLPWIQIRCTVMQLQRSKTELKAIEDEAKARAEAAALAEAALVSANANAAVAA